MTLFHVASNIDKIIIMDYTDHGNDTLIRGTDKNKRGNES